MIIEVSDNSDMHSLLPRVIEFVKKFVWVYIIEFEKIL